MNSEVKMRFPWIIKINDNISETVSSLGSSNNQSLNLSGLKQERLVSKEWAGISAPRHPLLLQTAALSFNDILDMWQRKEENRAQHTPLLKPLYGRQGTFIHNSFAQMSELCGELQCCGREQRGTGFSVTVLKQ
jgi:hypothetical protein